jgi:polar amino acid transport system permease protein
MIVDILQKYWVYLLIGDYPHGALGGLAMTLLIAVLCLVLTFPSAVLVALARTGGIKALAYPAIGFVYVIRAMPLLMLIFWVYFFLPLVLGFPISAVWSIVLSIVTFQTAYLSEVIRAAIEALPKGQTEAARALGLKYWPTTFKIVLPQALSNALPGILNQFTSIIKDTSLGYVLSVGELTYSAGSVNNFLMVRPFEVYAILAMIYFAMCAGVAELVHRFERHLVRRRLAAEAH